MKDVKRLCRTHFEIRSMHPKMMVTKHNAGSYPST
jgi:hypothetical protein